VHWCWLLVAGLLFMLQLQFVTFNIIITLTYYICSMGWLVAHKSHQVVGELPHFVSAMFFNSRHSLILSNHSLFGLHSLFPSIIPKTVVFLYQLFIIHSEYMPNNTC